MDRNLHGLHSDFVEVGEQTLKVQVHYAAQLRDAAGVATETIELDTEVTFRELLDQVASRHGKPLSDMLIDEEGNPHQWIIADRGGTVIRLPSTVLTDGDVVRLLSPISGG